MIKLRRLLRKNLRVRLTAWYGLLIATTVILFCFYLYWQLEKSLLHQLDITLEVTSSEMLNTLIERDNHPAFWKTARSKANPRRWQEAGLAVRLISIDGQIWDGVGQYQILPFFLPRQNGYINLEEENHTWRLYNQRLTWGEQGGWIQVGQSLQPIRDTGEHLLTVMVLAVPLVLGGVSLGGFLLADWALRPIAKIIETAQSIRHDEISRRINYQGYLDEVGKLALTIDRMLDRLQKAIEHERRFSSDASHELRTPLTVIKGRIGVTLSRPRLASEYVSTLLELDGQVDLLIRLANSLLFLTRLEQESLIVQAVNLSCLLSALVEQLEILAVDKGVHLAAHIAPNLVVGGNSDYLTSLFLNLLDNALKYTPASGKVLLEAYQSGERVLIDITNTGAGIPPEALPHIFERFYRLEAHRSRHTGGTGLGLAIVQEIVRLHGAEIAVTSHTGKFTRFSLSFSSF